MAMGLARLMSPTGVVAENLVDKLQQGTLKEKMANIAIYFGEDPAKIGGTTQSITKFMADTISRQGETSENLRNQYSKNPSGTSFKSYLEKSPVNKYFHSDKFQPENISDVQRRTPGQGKFTIIEVK